MWGFFIPLCVAPQPGHRLQFRFSACNRNLLCLVAAPSTPQQQATGIEWPKLAHVGIRSPEWIILVLEMVKGLLSSKLSNQQIHFDRKALRAGLPPDLVRWHPALWAHLAEGFLSLLWISPGRRRAFWGMIERTCNCHVFCGVFCLLTILPMQTAFHIVFSSSPLGQTLLFFTKRKDVVAYRPGGERACLCCLYCIHLWVL